MAQSTKGVPEGVSPIIPRLFCRDVAAEIEFCQTAFEAEQLNRRDDSNGRALHALMRISGAMLMLESEYPTLPSRCPATDGSSPVPIYLYLADVDAAVERAVSAGSQLLIPLQDQFWGDRIAWLLDPAGHVWTVATRIEETSTTQRDRRWENIRAAS